MAKELYVGHLPFETTENDLRRLFAVAGTVTSVHIITDTESGRSKGCAYVRMATAEAMKDAIESLDGALVEGRRGAATPPRHLLRVQRPDCF